MGSDLLLIGLPNYLCEISWNRMSASILFVFEFDVPVGAVAKGFIF